MTPTQRARCRARVAWRWDPERGFVAVQCHQYRGLRGEGEWLYCAAPGHREQVIGMSRRAAA